LRVYIDAEAGINVDDCAAVSHQVSALLDVENPIAGEYFLEVSSPGMDCPLFTIDQYRNFIGAQIDVRLKISIAGRRKFKAKLLAVSEEHLSFAGESAENDFDVPIANIMKARVQPAS